MASVATVKAKILAGQVVGLQEDIRRIVGAASSSGEGQQIIRTCSRFIYENQNLGEQQFSAILEIVSICCEHHHQHLITDPFFHLRSMHYIFLLSVRRKEFHRHLMGLASSTELFIELCDTSSREAQSIIKQMHQMLWNTSLTRSSPLEALILQRFAFQCSLAIGNSLSQVCEQAARAHSVYENAVKSAEKSDQYFEAIFKYLTQALSKQSACDEGTVLSIVSLVMEYAKVAVEAGECSGFSRNNKQVVKLLEGHCNPKMVTGLKAGLKLPEMAIGLRLGKCGEDMLKKFLGACGHVAALPSPNTILILGLVTTMSILKQHLRSNLRLSSYIVELLMKRCRTPISEDTVKKVLCLLSQQLSGFFDMASNTQESDALFTHVVPWADTTKPFILSNVSGQQDRLAALYNFGAHFGNLGSLAYRRGNYTASAKFLELTVDFFDHYCLHASEEQKQSVFPNLGKRLRLWSDALRYSNQHWEAGVAAGRGFLRGCLPAEDLVIAWVKCKRDAKRVGSKALRGKTVCDVVSEARRKHQEAKGIVFDQAAALLLEIQYYRQQSYNTSEEQLCCGRLVADRVHGVESSVWGLLSVAETLWTHPDLAAEEQEASCAVQQAKDLLQEARAGGTKEPVFLELEALAHFWHYLCYIQMMYTKADAEVKESKKPNPLTAQVTELGEEEQVHDACDVRPTALLTLHTQHTSLTPVQAALDIWEKFVMQDLPLKNASMTCASLTSVGYIYHLSGLVTPTIQAWGLLISLARKHSLQNYLIKGIVELLLTTPELVDSDLVEELQQVMSSSVAAASTQDTTQACLILTASVAIALHYYRIGQYDAGVKLIEEALRSEVLTRRTIKTTEVQTLVHLVASLYAWLPPWLLHPPPALPAPCFSLALLACREASALVQTALTDSNKEIICWRHRVASLLMTTTAWLGHLSITIAQPRTARAYLEKSLQFSQKLILPLRIAEFLELLARVDMLCDQLEDCRVKVDSLEALLKTHPSSQDDLENLAPEFIKLAITKPAKSRSKKGPEIFCDPVLSNGERMRTESGMQEFSLKDIPPSLQVEAEETANFSPSMEYRERVAIVRFSPCPSGVQCVLCTNPVINHLRISTSVLLALLHAHGERFQTAQRCVEHAQTMYAEAAEKSHEVAAYMISLLKRDTKKCAIAPSMFVLSRLNLVRLQTFHARAECLGLEGKWEKALSANLESLQTLASLDTQLLVQDMHFAALLAVQGQDLERILTRYTKSSQDVSQSVVVGQQQDKNETCTITVTTPKTSTRKIDGSCKKTAQHLLNAPKHVNKKNLIFSIFSDEEEDGSEETKPPRFATPHKPIPHTPSNKFFKSERKRPPSSIRKKERSENKVLNSLEADWVGGLPSLVLKVPSDLPLSPLNSTPYCPSTQLEVAKLGCTTSPQSTAKTRGRGQPRMTRASKEAKTRGKSPTTILSQNPEDVKPQGATAPLRGRSRTTRAASASASKAKIVTEPKTTTRTRASRSLRLM